MPAYSERTRRMPNVYQRVRAYAIRCSVIALILVDVYRAYLGMRDTCVFVMLTNDFSVLNENSDPYSLLIISVFPCYMYF